MALLLISFCLTVQIDKTLVATVLDAAPQTLKDRPDPELVPTTAEKGNETGNLLIERGSVKTTGLNNRSSSRRCCFNSLYSSKETGSPSPGTGPAGGGNLF